MFVSKRVMRILPAISPLLLRRAGIAVILLVALSLALHWRPSRQVRLHQEHLLLAVGERNWRKVGDLVATDYRDRWQQDRKILLTRLPQFFQDFFVCGVLGGEPTMDWQGGACAVKSRIRFVGTGGPIAQFIIRQSEEQRQPFTFRWRHQSWKPWDWALVEVDQPELEIPQDSGMEL
jgi:hypothetical protein